MSQVSYFQNKVILQSVIGPGCFVTLLSAPCINISSRTIVIQSVIQQDIASVLAGDSRGSNWKTERIANNTGNAKVKVVLRNVLKGCMATYEFHLVCHQRDHVAASYWLKTALKMGPG